MQPDPKLLLLSNSTQQLSFYVKIASIILVELITLGFGFIPLCVTQLKANSKLLSYSNAFSGGLFMGIGLFHLLPEANLLISTVQTSPNSFPLGYFVAFLSYSLILCIEKVLFDSQSLTDHYDSSDHDVHDTAMMPQNTKPLLEEYTPEKEMNNEKDKDNDDINEETIKNVVTSKGKFVSFLHVRNISKIISF